MIYRVLADVVMVVHFTFLAFVTLGAALVFWKRWIALLHVPAFLWGALISLAGWICPLTPLENHLLHLGGARGYDTGFIDHYIAPILYPAGLTRSRQIVMGVAVLVLNGALYAWILVREKGRAR
jgi:hypothetical protein